MKTRGSKNVKLGAKHFGIAFLLFVVIFVGVGIVASAVGDISLFSQDKDSQTAQDFHLLSIVDTDNPFFDAFSDSKRINALVLGTNTSLADTIILASFDPDQGNADLISIPRDTYYQREGKEQKINATYHGEPVNTAKAVSDVLQGMPIHYYAVVDFEGVENIVESMGGVPMDVPFHMYYNDVWDDPPLHIDIKEGQQTLNGEDAVKFLRFRHGDEGYPDYPTQDLGRMEAQQKFIKSAFQQSIGHLPSVMKSVHSNVESNIDLKTALSLAAKAVGMSSESIAAYSLPGEWVSPYYRQDVDATKAIIQEIYAVPKETTGGAIEGESE